LTAKYRRKSYRVHQQNRYNNDDGVYLFETARINEHDGQKMLFLQRSPRWEEIWFVGDHITPFLVIVHVFLSLLVSSCASLFLISCGGAVTPSSNV
jgi:hypothetical protein